MREVSAIVERHPRSHNPYTILGHLDEIPNRLWELMVMGRKELVEFVDKVSSYGCWCQLRRIRFNSDGTPGTMAIPKGKTFKHGYIINTPIKRTLS